jgi:hypothetical protein
MMSKDPRLSRFSKKSKDLLIDYINFKNNRGFRPDQILFGVPELIDPNTGLTHVELQFKEELGWSRDKAILAYKRVDVNQLMQNQPIVLHVSDDTPEAVYAALMEQYGWLLEPELADLVISSAGLESAAGNTQLSGFEAEDAPGDEEEVPPPYLVNKNYVLTFKPENLVYFGEAKIFTRRSAELLGTTIDSFLDLREFYADGKYDLPFIDLFGDAGTFYVTDEKMDHDTRRAWESTLYELSAEQTIEVGIDFPKLMKLLTGDEWVISAEKAPFNLSGVKVVYNGFVSKDYTVPDPAFNYVVALELGPLCDNLQGIFKIGYRFSDSKTPGNLPYDRASVHPLFTR